MKLSQETKNTTERVIHDVHCYLMRTHGITAPKSACKSLRQQLHNEFHARERECIRRTLEAKANELGYTLIKSTKLTLAGKALDESSRFICEYDAEAEDHDAVLIDEAMKAVKSAGYISDGTR